MTIILTDIDSDDSNRVSATGTVISWTQLRLGFQPCIELREEEMALYVRKP